MILSVKELTDDTEFVEIARIDAAETGEREIVDGEDELLAMDDREIWMNMPVDRLAMRYNGPVVMLDVIDE